MYDSDFEPYRCPRCDKCQRFGSLITLRMHMAIVHSASLDEPEKDLTTLSLLTEDDGNWLYVIRRKGDAILRNSSLVNQYKDAIGKVYEDFSERADMIVQKYDREFEEMKENLRIARKLEVLRKRKQKLQESAFSFESTDSYKSYAKVFQAPNTLFEAANASVKVENDVHASNKFSTDRETIHPVQTKLSEQLELSIQLAAKYKGETLEMKKKLQETERCKNDLESYLQMASEKEIKAKTKLQEFMESLLERTESAEERLQFYESQISQENKILQFHNSVDSRSSFGSSTSQSRAPRHWKNKHDIMHGKKPPIENSYSSPSTPPEILRSRKKQMELQRMQFDDDYVTELLEPPSSQELPRKWRKKRNVPIDQLPGIDLSNVVDTSIVWPFANISEAHKTLSSTNSTECSIQTDINQPIPHHNMVVRRRIVLFCIFAYLDTEVLLQCSFVCKEWRDISRHPKLWTRVIFESKRISSEFLQTISVWCSKTFYIRLRDIKGRRKRQEENLQQYHDSTRGCLEDGLEILLKACGKSLVILTLDNCDHFITRRVLWLASCYCRELRSLKYHSTEPINREMIWSLGSGCQKLVSLDVAPTFPCKEPQVFNNKVLQLISWCWPNLRGLSVGGKCIDKKGLVSIVSSCRNLQVLELSHMNEITEEIAKDMVKHGLKCLSSLMLTHTPVRTRTLLCLLNLASSHQLVSLRVQLSFSDYCLASDKQPHIIAAENVDKTPIFEAFNRAMENLMRLQRKPIYTDVLKIVCTT